MKISCIFREEIPLSENVLSFSTKKHYFVTIDETQSSLLFSIPLEFRPNLHSSYIAKTW